MEMRVLLRISTEEQDLSGHGNVRPSDHALRNRRRSLSRLPYRIGQGTNCTIDRERRGQKTVIHSKNGVGARESVGQIRPLQTGFLVDQDMLVRKDETTAEQFDD